MADTPLPPAALYVIKPTEHFIGSEREIEKTYVRLEHVPGYNNSIFANVDLPRNTKLMAGTFTDRLLCLDRDLGLAYQHT